MRRPLIIVGGPTASGKTALAIALAQKLDGEILSADSMQIYQGMEIATAKPTPFELSQAKHHMIGCVPAEHAYSAARYAQDAAPILEDIRDRGKTCILCGGTGLYMDALLYGLDSGETGANEELRCRLTAYAQEKGPQALHEMLANINPEAAEEIHPNNVKRVIRAIELGHSAPVKPKERKAKYDYIRFVLTMPREILYARINDRVDEMLKEGLLAETEAFYAGQAGSTAQYAIGYKELYGYISGQCSLDDAVENLKRETRRYAKRQETWFKRYPDAIMVDRSKYASAEKCAAELIKIIEKQEMV